MSHSPRRLSILIATIGRRNESFLRLANELLHQAKDSPIEVIAYWNNGEESIGHIRQNLLEASEGEYVCFIDDDDWVPTFYCQEIMDALGEDYVGFQVELHEGDRPMPPVFHSLKYREWSQDGMAYYRGVTHLNPIRRELALMGNFGLQGMGEDETWSRMVTPFAKTEKYIPRIMYHYYHNADDTTFGGADKPHQDFERPIVENPQFRWHPDSKKKGSM
jgi:glycosyltransferase involved in cell wall biosynthesis